MDFAQGLLFENQAENFKMDKQDTKVKLKKVKVNKSYSEIKRVKINLPEYKKSIETSF